MDYFACGHRYNFPHLDLKKKKTRYTFTMRLNTKNDKCRQQFLREIQLNSTSSDKVTWASEIRPRGTFRAGNELFICYIEPSSPRFWSDSFLFQLIYRPL